MEVEHEEEEGGEQNMQEPHQIPIIDVDADVHDRIKGYAEPGIVVDWEQDAAAEL